jgi:glycosyltransferase involved in cell wall biosynthesis
VTRARVVHIITKLELGGAQEATICEVRNLPRERYDVTLVAGEPGLLTEAAKRLPRTEFIEVPELVREVSPVKDVLALVKLYGIIRERVKDTAGPVIVHTHSSKAGILGRWAAALAGASHVVHSIHGYGFNDYQRPLKRALFVQAEKLTARITDAFTADSMANIDRGRRYGLFRNAHAKVVRCAIPVDYFSASPGLLDKAGLGVPEDAPVVTMVSCLKAQKAPLDFVRVAARVIETMPDAHFLQVGDGELRDAVQGEAERLGIEKSYHLLGWRRDVREIIHLSDVMVLTSLWEGLPKVLPQAMAAGRPVVATAVDGTPEAIRDGVNGFLAKPHDVESMAQKVVVLLKDKGLAARMGEAGRAMVAEFDEARMLADLGVLYERLLGEAV